MEQDFNRLGVGRHDNHLTDSAVQGLGGLVCSLLCLLVVRGLLNEIEHFFTVYKDLESGDTSVRGYGDRQEALDIIHACRERAVTA